MNSCTRQVNLFVSGTHAVEIEWVSEACFGSGTHTLEIGWVSDACSVSDTHAFEIGWVLDACFVSDTHTLNKLLPVSRTISSFHAQF